MSCNSEGIDIIIPVYNAYEDLVACINSIKKYTDLNFNKVILINDKSTDARIDKYIRDVQTSGIQVVNNEKNLGFSGSVNVGILQSNKDVLLLNSDTIVTRNWIDKIVSCAYSNKGIGTVTPLSNNATICSVPEFSKDNEVPNGFTIDEYANLIEKCSIKQYPKIPVGMGFCMFIKREVIDYVGLFDEYTFGRGYGEENDFCSRAEQLGYYHVMCDDTFIFHRGKMSFTEEEKERYVQRNEKVLIERYADQMEATHTYWVTNPDQLIRDNINIEAQINNGRKNVLYLVQADFRVGTSNNVGGTQFHVKDLVEGLKDECNLFVVARNGTLLSVTVYSGNDVTTLNFYIGASPKFPEYNNTLQQKLYRLILNVFHIDTVHVHHTLGLSFDLYYEAFKLGIPIILTLHDFYYVCPTFLLLNKQHKLCIRKANDRMCRECLNYRLGISDNINYLKKWRAEVEEVLRLCSKIIIPTQSAKDIFTLYYPTYQEKIKVIEHGISYMKANYIPKEPIITNSHKSHIEYAFSKTGNEQMIEGWSYVEGLDSKYSKVIVKITSEQDEEVILQSAVIQRVDVAQQNDKNLYSGFSITVPQQKFNCTKVNIRIYVENEGEIYTNGEVISINRQHYKQKPNLNVAFVGGISLAKGSQSAYRLIKNSNEDINWFIMGGIGDVDLYELNKNNLIKTGWYNKEDLVVLLKEHEIDLVCILSIVPETFCFTLSEALAAEIPLIVTDIGALGERIRSMRCGWAVSVDNTVEEVENIIRQIRENPSIYKEKKSIVKGLKHKSVTEMAQEYSEIYSMFNNENVKYDEVNRSELYELLYRVQEGTSTYILERLNQVETEIQLIYGSLGYKALMKIRKIPIPFKRQIKRILINITKSTKSLKNKIVK